MGRAWVGTSGFTYAHWRGVLYPRGMPTARWFEHYVRHFNTVELNVTFYRLPSEDAFRGWAARAPEGFRFVLKGSRYLTHVKRLLDPEEGLRRLFARARPLGEALAAVLWQLPPGMVRDDARLRGFLEALHDASPPGVRHAFEFRDASWFAPEVHAALDEVGMAVALADAPLQVLPPRARAWPVARGAVRVPAPRGWAYVRRHGPTGRYRGGYPRAWVASDARRVRAWAAEGLDVYAFYNNDIGGHAVRDALRLARAVDAPPAGRPAAPPLPPTEALDVAS